MFFFRSVVLLVDFEGCIKVDVIGLAEQAWQKVKHYLQEQTRKRDVREGEQQEVQSETGGG